MFCFFYLSKMTFFTSLLQHGRFNSVFTRGVKIKKEIQSLHLLRWGPQCRSHGSQGSWSRRLFWHRSKRDRHNDGNIHEKFRISWGLYRWLEGENLASTLTEVFIQKNAETWEWEFTHKNLTSSSECMNCMYLKLLRSIMYFFFFSKNLFSKYIVHFTRMYVDFITMSYRICF